MKKIALGIVAIAALSSGVACRKKPVTEPTPQRVADSVARERARLDSIARAEAENARLSADRAREENLRAQQQLRSAQQTMAAPIYFELDDADLTPEAVGILEAKAAIMLRQPLMRIRITGHTDEQGSDEYNLALGMRRAASVKHFLVERGIDAGRFETATRGEEEPAAQGHDESAWSKNRRCEFIVISR